MLKHHISKKTMALMLLFTLVFSCICLNTETVFAKKTVYSYGSGSYTIISEGKKEVAYNSLSERCYTVADIPLDVVINKVTYNVTQINDDALSNSKVKKVTIGEGIKKIGKRAFYNCKNLKSITIKSELLKKGSIGANAFKGLPSDAVVTVPKEKLSTYKSILKSKGLKNQKVKAAAQSSTANSDSAGSKLSENASFDLSKSMFDSDICFSRINSEDGVYTSELSAGDSITIKTKFGFKPGIYGHWEEDSRKLVKGYVQCGRCGRCFSDYMLALHNEMELEEGGCRGNYYIAESFKIPPTTWAFIPDKTPCQAVVKYTLPTGVSYKDGSMKISRWLEDNDYTDSCKINVSENVITITIDDVKASPFYKAFNYESYKKDLYYRPSLKNEDDYHKPLFVKFDVVTDSQLASESVISTDISYSYKGTSNTESYEALIHTASLQVLNEDAEGNSISGAEFELYQRRANIQDEGKRLKSTSWKLFKSGIHAGNTITGLGAGDGFENEYKIVQTKTPAGYEETELDTEFALTIGRDGTASAEDENGKALKTEGGTVKVTVVNAKSTSGMAASASANTGSDSVKADEVKTGSDKQTSVKNNDIPEITTGILAVYFEDGVKECSMKRSEKIDSAGMIPTKSVSYRAYKFEGCHLAKLTLNGEEIDSIPDKVKDGSTICFYYESN
jgi:hypothetical protein